MADHVSQCKICQKLSSEDLEALEREALERQRNYTTIGAEYGVKYKIKITKQNVSQHMKWLRDKKIAVEREKLLDEQKENVLDTLKEHEKIHQWLWGKIEELEIEKKKTSTVDQLLRLSNTQDRLIKSLLKGIGILADIRGDRNRDVRKLSIDVVLKNLQEQVKFEEEE